MLDAGKLLNEAMLGPFLIATRNTSYNGRSRQLRAHIFVAPEGFWVPSLSNVTIMNKHTNAPRPWGWLRWFVGALSILAVPMYGQQALPRAVIASGGSVKASSGASYLSSTIGQVVAGRSSIQLFETNNQGFWLPIERVTTVRPDETATDDASLTAYPNPFSSATTIRVEAALSGEITVRIRDLVGGHVRTLASSAVTGQEQHVIVDGLTDAGDPMAAGAYTYEIAARSITGQPLRFVGRLQVVR